jgi:hypothetical protein
MTPKVRFGLLLFSCLGILVGSDLHSTDFRPLSIDYLSSKAALVLHGKVVGTTVQRDPDGRIYTKVELEVIDTWKGVAAAKRFTLVHSGGVLGDEWSTTPGQEQYELGEEVITFLVMNHRGEAVTLGLTQGKFHVSEEPASGQKQAHNLFHGHPPRKEGLENGGDPKRPALSLVELKRRVQAPKL